MTKSARELLAEWLELKKRYDSALAEYVSDEISLAQPTRKVLTQEALEEFKALAEEVERAHQAWLEALRTRTERSA